MLENEETTQAPEQVEQQDDSGQSLPEAPSQLVDLDSVEKFRFSGREWTPKELYSSVMAQADYTRKTQALAEERRYIENLQHDLEYVRSNADAAAKFREVYPSKYHTFLNYVLKEQEAAQAQQNGQAGPNATLPPEVLKRLEKIELLENDFRERQTKAAEAELNATIDPLLKKYPFADEEAALARGQQLLNQGVELNAQTWERIFKSLHERTEKTWKQHQSQAVTKQKEASKRGADVGSGGGIPGTAPKNPRTIQEASKMLREHMGIPDNSR